MDELFDRQAIALHRERALKTGDRSAAFLLSRVAGEVADRLSLVDRQFDHATVTSANVELLGDFLQGTRHEGLVCEACGIEDWTRNAEELPRGSGSDKDLALSLLTLHETNDTPGALIHIRRRLKPDGLFMGVMPGAGTLQELRESWLSAETELTGGAGPRVYPFADVRTAGDLLQRAGFALPVIDTDSVVVRYSDMFALMRDLRAMGATNALAARHRRFTRRDVMIRAAQIYQERFADPDGKIPATFHFIFMSGWAPDASQQKPAKRGSATVSLAEALKSIK